MSSQHLIYFPPDPAVDLARGSHAGDDAFAPSTKGFSPDQPMMVCLALAVVYAVATQWPVALPALSLSTTVPVLGSHGLIKIAAILVLICVGIGLLLRRLSTRATHAKGAYR